MPLANYGVLAARAVERHREGGTDSPHYEVHLLDDAGTHYRAAVNVRSKVAPHELMYVVVDDFRHPLTQRLPAAGSGWKHLDGQADGAALDFVRGNLFDPAAMRVLPPDLPGVDNDLSDLFDHYVQRAIADHAVAVYVFGDRFGPEPGKKDSEFGFQPSDGVHEIHMNQGNSKGFEPQDGVRQDGGLLFHLPAEDRWVAVFLAFQSQKWHTDPVTGHAIPGSPERLAGAEAPLTIIAALANPGGPAPRAGTVTLLNTSAVPVDLTGWRLADEGGHPLPLPARKLGAGATLTVDAGEGDGFRLGDQGGTITLLDPSGLKVHGVAYTARQASAEGRTITF
ncbi:DUF2278 family protein [Streptomyces sp. NPDC006670]|uniref:DUF2278 family protein n=1 Tax=Streptomyces sp. NPDC006670 TaxID=3154476 RepID=UPI0033D5020A